VLCSARRLVTLVAERAESERRLRGFALHAEHDIPETLMIAGDPRVLITALSGLLLATCAVIENRSSVRISLSASVDATRQIEFAVSEVGSGVSTAWESRAFDSTWNERPGGVSAAVWMLAARTIAESYGGHVSVSVTARGTTARMVMPVAAA
jgi:signal transduction histidine kinase